MTGRSRGSLFRCPRRRVLKSSVAAPEGLALLFVWIWWQVARGDRSSPKKRDGYPPSQRVVFTISKP
ncbi:MAG: hypothetical protein AAF685_17990 [Cyanobacteria bacterium P01_C01_bin.89]